MLSHLLEGKVLSHLLEGKVLSHLLEGKVLSHLLEGKFDLKTPKCKPVLNPMALGQSRGHCLCESH